MGGYERPDEKERRSAPQGQTTRARSLVGHTRRARAADPMQQIQTKTSLARGIISNDSQTMPSDMNSMQRHRPRGRPRRGVDRCTPQQATVQVWENVEHLRGLGQRLRLRNLGLACGLKHAKWVGTWECNEGGPEGSHFFYETEYQFFAMRKLVRCPQMQETWGKYQKKAALRLSPALTQLHRVWLALRGCARVIPMLRAWRARAAERAYAPGGVGFKKVATETLVGGSKAREAWSLDAKTVWRDRLALARVCEADMMAQNKRL